MKEILIIEDEAIIAQNIIDIMVKNDYKVLKTIPNGDEAIDYLSFHQPDLVLCDINIKGTKDGIEVAKIIQKKKKIPFIFLTSYSDKHTLGRAKEALPYSYVVKPFTEKDVTTAIEIALFKFEQEIQSMTLTKETVNEIAKEDLTDKEFLIIENLINSLEYENICEKQGISMNTLKFHLKNIYRNFEVSNRASLMQYLLSHYIHTKE
jgi:DNA-binding NarL/FixJ family response regulator